MADRNHGGGLAGGGKGGQGSPQKCVVTLTIIDMTSGPAIVTKATRQWLGATPGRRLERSAK